MALGEKERARIRKLQTQEFGSLFLANLVEEKVGACEIIDSVLPRRKGKRGPAWGSTFCSAPSTA